MADATGTCAICDQLRDLTPETEIWRDGSWSAYAASAQTPGWVILALDRHAEGVWSLDAAEQASLGPALARVSGAARDALGAERVYYVSLGESSAHYHGVLIPRIDDLTLAGAIRDAMVGAFKDPAEVDAKQAARTNSAIRDATLREA